MCMDPSTHHDRSAYTIGVKKAQLPGIAVDVYQ